MCDGMTDGQNDKKFSTWNPEAKCMVCTWLKNSPLYLRAKHVAEKVILAP